MLNFSLSGRLLTALSRLLPPALTRRPPQEGVKYRCTAILGSLYEGAVERSETEGVKLKFIDLSHPRLFVMRSLNAIAIQRGRFAINRPLMRFLKFMTIKFFHKTVWGKCATKIVRLSKRRVLSVHKLAITCEIQSAFFPNLI